MSWSSFWTEPSQLYLSSSDEFHAMFSQRILSIGYSDFYVLENTVEQSIGFFGDERLKDDIFDAFPITIHHSDG